MFNVDPADVGFTVVCWETQAPQQPSMSKLISCTVSVTNVMSLIEIHLTIIVSSSGRKIFFLSLTKKVITSPVSSDLYGTNLLVEVSCLKYTLKLFMEFETSKPLISTVLLKSISTSTFPWSLGEYKNSTSSDSGLDVHSSFFIFSVLMFTFASERQHDCGHFGGFVG